ncbi:MAG: amidohydrolase family protein [Limnochordia bacterium]|jgi:predicted TIM-barrel fold metal-dependent hydrolase
MRLVEAGEMLGIMEYWCSRPMTARYGSLEEVRAGNDAVLAAMRRYPQRIRGLCFVVPGYFREACAEIERCLDAGMIGVKLYHQYKINDPAVWPVIELCTERQIPILMHAGCLTDPQVKAEQPRLSHGGDFAEVSQRYPDTLFIMAHIGGGGDWEWTLRALRDSSPNVYVDVSGSNLDDGQVEFAVAELGAERILFGTDGTMAGCVGKVVGASLTEEQRDLIFRGNAERLLAAQGLQPLAKSESTQEGAAG